MGGEGRKELLPGALPGASGLGIAWEGTDHFLRVQTVPQDPPHAPLWITCQMVRVMVLSAAPGCWKAFEHPLGAPKCAMIQTFIVFQKFLVALGATQLVFAPWASW